MSLPLPHTHTLWRLIVTQFIFFTNPPIPDDETLTKKHCFCTPTAFPDTWGTRISKFSRGSLPSDPPSLGMLSFSRKPPISERAPRSRSMRRRSYSTWKLNFPSKAEYFWSTHSPCYTCLGPKIQEMAVLGGQDFNISGGHAPGPPRSSRLPPLADPLFLNFLDPSLIWCVFPRGHLTFFTNIPIPDDESQNSMTDAKLRCAVSCKL